MRQGHLVGREADDEHAAGLRDRVERGAHRLLGAGRLDDDLRQLAAAPFAGAGDEIVAGLEQGEVGPRGAAALEPRGDAVDDQHRRAAVERGDRDGLADRPGAEHEHALAGRDAAAHHRAHGDRHGLDEGRQPRIRVRDGERLRGGIERRSWSAPSRWMPISSMRSQALPRPSRQAWQLPQAITGQTATRWPAASPGGQSGPTSSTIAENSCPWMRG